MKNVLNDEIDDLVLEHSVCMVVRDEERNVIALEAGQWEASKEMQMDYTP